MLAKLCFCPLLVIGKPSQHAKQDWQLSRTQCLPICCALRAQPQDVTHWFLPRQCQNQLSKQTLVMVLQRVPRNGWDKVMLQGACEASKLMTILFPCTKYIFRKIFILLPIHIFFENQPLEWDYYENII